MKHELKKLTQFVAFATVLLLGACSNVDELQVGQHPTNDSVLFAEPLMGNPGQFTPHSVAGEQVWTGDRNYISMTGHVDKVNHANEDWLVSSAIDLRRATAAKLTFQHVVRYFEAELAASATVWISENYTSGAPSSAQWTQLITAPFTDYRNWNFVPSGEISLTAWVGKQVHIAFKYLSSDANAGTWQIRNVKVINTEAIVNNVSVGEGTEKSPFSVDEAHGKQGTPGCWVEGYIVGYLYVGASDNRYVFDADTCSQATNLLLASSPDGVYEATVIPVQLPPGAVRNGLNLKDNKGHLLKKVKLYGNLTSYFKVPGMREVSYFELEDGSSGGSKPIDISTAILFESFLANLGKFTTHSVMGYEQWTFNSKFKCAYISGYVGGTYRANEDWLISPLIDLTAKSSAVCSFDHALRYNANPAQDATVWFSTDYTSGAPADATWVQLPTAFQDGSTWDFVNVGDISLEPALGKKIRIALVYKSGTAKAGTWEVRNFIVK